MQIIRWVLLGLAVHICMAAPAHAQEPAPAPVAEVRAGMAAFVDEVPIGHGVAGAAARVYLTQWLSAGPEVFYMVGPGDDRDLFVLGTLTMDVIVPPGGRRRLVTPYVMAGAGIQRHSDRVGRVAFSSVEAAVTAGGGVRFRVGDRVQIGGECRLGWELHAALLGTVGIALRKARLAYARSIAKRGVEAVNPEYGVPGLRPQSRRHA